MKRKDILIVLFLLFIIIILYTDPNHFFNNLFKNFIQNIFIPIYKHICINYCFTTNDETF